MLGPDLNVTRGDLSRNSLTLQTIRLPSQAERMAWLAQQLPELKGSGIIYTLTVRDANQVAEWLKSQGLNVEAYTREKGDNRALLEQALLNNKVKALVATTALGMGYDKPDLAFVIHYQMPGSVTAYYQQVGRAGRALPSAYGVLLSGEEETAITSYFIDNAFPTRNEVQRILNELETEPMGLSVSNLLERLNINERHITKTIDLLLLESPAPLARIETKYQLTAAKLSESFWQRAERLTNLRREEQEQMQQYLSLADGHMEFLIRALDGDPEEVAAPLLPPLTNEVDDKLIIEAIAFLQRTSLPIEPRKKWPNGGLPKYGVKGLIPEDHQAQPGRALCIWGDSGWSSKVRLGKYRDHKFSDDLVTACVKMVQDWDPQPKPTWVTCIPSQRHPDLVPNFSKRLANALGLPFHTVIERTSLRPEQKMMANSTQQARNLDNALFISTNPLPLGPVLLVDDMVDSGWTITVATWLLRSKISNEVFPLVLADTGH